MSSVGEILDDLEWPSLEAQRDQSSLLLFHKIHCGAVPIEKDKYMTPAALLTVWKLPGHHIVLNTADTRHTVMPWRIPFSPELFHIGIVCLLLWQIPSPQRSLGHSLFKQKFSQKFCVVFFVLFCFFVLFLLFLFYQNFQIRTPWCNAQVWAKPVTIERKKWSLVLDQKTRFTSLRENGILKTDSKEKANICNRQFQSAFTHKEDFDPPSKGASSFSSIGDITSDPKGVAKPVRINYNRTGMHQIGPP